ncbi:MAG TPA: glycosyltransferase family 4 protein [Candidatus Limnocylindrales bacterium]|nr:glycosyltransferase family 4 protein [Candidatus Limnocylindrales bacterium]
MLTSINHGDAISNEVLEIKKILDSWGYKSMIFSQHTHSKLAHVTQFFTEYRKYSSPENILIFHFSIGSEISHFVKNLPDKKIIIYHNITPHRYFEGINDTLAQLLKDGRKELAEYAGLAVLALGDSEFNKKELEELGFKNTGVLPIIIDFEIYKQEPDKKVLKKFDDNNINFLFVGRLSPNKKQEDIIKTFYYYTKLINSRSRLFLVGSYEGTKKYQGQLQNLVRQLDLKNVHIIGQVDFKELLAYYKLADVFISMSEHEGFCVPLVESMYFGIPIIAFDSTAIPYTLNGCGVLFKEKRYEEIAELVNFIIENKEFKHRIIEKQRIRLKQFDKPILVELLKGYIEKVS